MARSLRYDRPGAWHHIMHRGARRETIFRCDDHCLLFLGSLEEAVEHHGLEVHAYSLMPNHYHLLVRSPLGNLSRCMRHLNGTCTQRLNLRYGWDGPVFRGRFRSQLVPSILTDDLPLGIAGDWEMIEAQLPSGWRAMAEKHHLIPPDLPARLGSKATDVSVPLRLVLFHVATNTSLKTTVAMVHGLD